MSDTARPLVGYPDDALPARASSAGIAVESPLRRGPLVVDLRAYEVTYAGRPVELTPRQVEILAVFLAAPDRVWSRDQLHWLCWGELTPSRRVDVQLCRIRSRLGIELFRNVRDRGWTLRCPAPGDATPQVTASEGHSGGGG